jgi:hypothetical protein
MLTCETRESALARFGRALADPTRCRILVALLDGVNYPSHRMSHNALFNAAIVTNFRDSRNSSIRDRVAARSAEAALPVATARSRYPDNARSAGMWDVAAQLRPGLAPMTPTPM